MASQNVHEFTDANFEGEVVSSDTPVLVDFWAEWCAPCRTLSPIIDAIAEDFAGRAKVGKVNTDNSRDIAFRYGINALPTIILFKNGEPVKKWIGFQRKEALAAALEEAVK